MKRGQNLKDDAAVLAEELKIDPGKSPESEAKNDIDPADGRDVEPKGSSEDGNPVDTPVDAMSKNENPVDTPAAAPLKKTEKKVRLILVNAATYTVAGESNIGKISKNAPFETDVQTAGRLLATGLFKKEE